MMSEKMPLGMILLVIFFVLGIVGVLDILLVTYPPFGLFNFGNTVFTGFISLVINVLFLAAFGVLIWGIFKRKKLAWKIGMAYFGVSILYMAFNFAAALLFPNDFFTMMAALIEDALIDSSFGISPEFFEFAIQLTLAIYFFSILAYLGIVAYWNKNKAFFVN